MKIFVEIPSDLIDWLDNQILESGLDESTDSSSISFLRGQVIEMLLKKLRQVP